MAQIIASIIIGTFGTIITYFGLRAYHIKNTIQDLPTSKIRSVAVGLCEVKGKALPLKSILKTPFTKQDCLFYHITIEEFRQQGKSQRWVTIISDKSTEPFLIQDETGTIQLDPTNAEFEYPKNAEFKSGLGVDPPKQIIEFIKEHNIKIKQLSSNYNGLLSGLVKNMGTLSHEGLFGINKTMRYTEYCIKPNQELYVLSNASIPNAIPPNTTQIKNKAYLNRPTQKLQLQYQKGLPFVISNKKEAQVISNYNIQIALFGGIGIAMIIMALFFLAI